MRACRIAKLTVLTLLLAAPAADAQQRTWISGESEVGVELMYGTPESDDILFAVRCDAKSKEIFVGFAHEPIGVPHGGAIDMVVFSEAGEATLPARVVYLDAMDITLIETTDVPAEALRAILTKGSTLSIMVEDGAEEIPLAGTADSFATLFAACGL